MATVCQVCADRTSRYTCPKCSLRYCSLPCYTAHSGPCTDRFYQDQVETSLRTVQRPDSQQARALQEALLRDQEAAEEHRDQLDLDDNVERLEQLALDDRIELDHLDADQTEQFRQYVRSVCSGAASVAGIDRWRPWWMSPHADDPSAIILATDVDRFAAWTTLPTNTIAGSSIVDVDADAADGGERAGATSEPAARPMVVSEAVKYHVVETLLSTAFVLRYYNGDWSIDAPSALNLAVDLAPDLLPLTSSDALMGGLVAGFVARCTGRSGVPIGPVLIALYDTLFIMKDAASVRRCLRQLIGLTDLVISRLRRRSQRHRVELVKRKVEFFVAYVDQCPTWIEAIRPEAIAQWTYQCRLIEDNRRIDEGRCAFKANPLIIDR